MEATFPRTKWCVLSMLEKVDLTFILPSLLNLNMLKINNCLELSGQRILVLHCIERIFAAKDIKSQDIKCIDIAKETSKINSQSLDGC